MTKKEILSLCRELDYFRNLYRASIDYGDTYDYNDEDELDTTISILFSNNVLTTIYVECGERIELKDVMQKIKSELETENDFIKEYVKICNYLKA